MLRHCWLTWVSRFDSLLCELSSLFHAAISSVSDDTSESAGALIGLKVFLTTTEPKEMAYIVSEYLGTSGNMVIRASESHGLLCQDLVRSREPTHHTPK